MSDAAFPAPTQLNPVCTPDGAPHTGTVFLRAAIDHPRWEVGEYTYASTFGPPKDWSTHLAPNLFDFSPEKLVIGKFCQIADGALFITASANHRYDGFSTYPFAIFGGGTKNRPSLPETGSDTVIGHDVWIGQGARILPGTQIGNGVIIGAGAVVGGRVPDYVVVAGNPARIVRQRFDAKTIAALLQLKWWDWPIAHILAQEQAICAGDLPALERAAP